MERKWKAITGGHAPEHIRRAFVEYAEEKTDYFTDTVADKIVNFNLGDEIHIDWTG